MKRHPNTISLYLFHYYYSLFIIGTILYIYFTISHKILPANSWNQCFFGSFFFCISLGLPIFHPELFFYAFALINNSFQDCFGVIWGFLRVDHGISSRVLPMISTGVFHVPLLKYLSVISFRVLPQFLAGRSTQNMFNLPSGVSLNIFPIICLGFFAEVLPGVTSKEFPTFNLDFLAGFHRNFC